MYTFALCLIAATASAVSIVSRVQDDQCMHYGTPHSEIDTQTYVIDCENTILAKDPKDTGATHGYIDMGDAYWDALNDKDNKCDWPEFVTDCGTD